MTIELDEATCDLNKVPVSLKDRPEDMARYATCAGYKFDKADWEGALTFDTLEEITEKAEAKAKENNNDQYIVKLVRIVSARKPVECDIIEVE